ncbi:hypothetical protein [Nocardia brasiliensis]|uniref:hypothetical protein n=1 Tax=Nocardia brasiliensis TaxID=37326 RepID=UPI0024569622|nr:hypothetical protein [Nocardia brasiliensis]
MPAPRKPPDPKTVAASVIEITGAVTALLKRASLTNKEALARAGNPVSQQTLSAQLHGQGGGPKPAVVHALVAVVAAELGTTTNSLYRENPALERHVRPNGPRPPSEDPSSPEFTPPPEIAAKADWLWGLIIEGRERLAAVALHGLPLEPGYPHAVLVGVICRYDPGAAAALMRAVEEVFGTERAHSLLADLSPRQLRIVTEFEVSHYLTRRPMWITEHRVEPNAAELAQGVGRRLRALINRGDRAQALRELTSLTNEDSSAAISAVRILIDTDRPDLVSPAIRPCMTVLNAMAHIPSEDEVETFTRDCGALYTIVEALLVHGRATNSRSYSRRVIEALEPTAFHAMLSMFTSRIAFDSSRAAVAYANLTDFVVVARDHQIAAALPDLTKGYHAANLARCLLEAGKGRLLVIAQKDPALVSKLIHDAWREECHRWPDDKPTRVLFESLALVVRVAEDDLLVHIACTWPAEALRWLVTQIAQAHPIAASRTARPLALLIAHVEESDRIALTEHVFHSLSEADESDLLGSQIRVWVELIVAAPRLAKTLAEYVAVHPHMLTLRGTTARIQPWFLDWDKAMAALSVGDFDDAAEGLRTVSGSFTPADLVVLSPAVLKLPRWIRNPLRVFYDAMRS